MNPTIRVGLTEETALDVDDVVFTRAQLERMDSQVLRRYAQHSPSDEVHHRSTNMELKDFYACQYTLNDFADADE